MNKFFIYILFFCSANLFSQIISSDIEVKLDSVINAKNSSHKVKYIYIIDHKVTVDSLTIKKVRSNKLDSTILIIYTNKTQKRIKATEFWGVIADYGNCNRFYNGRTFSIDKSEAPYFYKITNKSSTHYYFSETLMGKIHPLNLKSINRYVTDSVKRDNMSFYFQEQIPKKNKEIIPKKGTTDKYYQDTDDDDQMLSRVITGSVNLTLFVIDVINSFKK